MPVDTAAGQRSELEVAALRERILRRIDPVLHAVGVDAHEVRCDVGGDLGDLHVILRGPLAATAIRQAIGVRVIDAVRGSGQTLGSVSVHYGGADDR